MQVLTELQFMIGMFSALSAFVASCYLLYKWKKYPNRLLTDMPFLFGIITVLITGNQLFINLVAIGYIPDTLEIFRIRAVLIGGIALPLYLLLLNIWAPRRRKYYPHVLLAFAAYWVGASLFAPSREIIMIMDIPLLLAGLLGLMATFIVTWKTGRLKEIRSDLLILGLLFMFISQVTKVWLLSIGFGWISDMFSSIGIISLCLGVINPWYKDDIRINEDQAIEVASV